MSLGASSRSSRSRAEDTGSNALTTSSDAPVFFASSVASRTACLAVSEPSVPTTMRANIYPLLHVRSRAVSRLHSAGHHRRESLIHSVAPMQRQPIPPFWLAVQVAIIVCVLISGVIVIVKL